MQQQQNNDSEIAERFMHFQGKRVLMCMEKKHSKFPAQTDVCFSQSKEYDNQNQRTMI